MGLSEDLFHKTVPVCSKGFNNQINLIIDDLLKISSKLEVYIFGSVAREEATNNSDLDVLIVVPDSEDHENIRSQFYRLKSENQFGADLVFISKNTFEKKETMLLQDAEKDLKQVYPNWNLN